MKRITKVSQTLSRSVETYDQHAFIQRFTAQRLASKIISDEVPSLGMVLEVGCGTGILSEHLASHAESYVMTDVSLPFVQKAQKKVLGDNVLPLVVDGERPCFTASFDVIVSNLVFHWFNDPKITLSRLVACLKPGGKLYVSVLGNNSLHEWRVAHSLVEASCGVLDFMSFGQLRNWLPLLGDRQVEEEWLAVNPANALAFLRSLKEIGEGLPHPGHKPLPYKIFKKVMEVYDRAPQSSFQILYGTYQKPEKIREE